MAETEKKKRPAIQIKGLTKIFTLGKEKVYALNGIDLEIYPSEIICLLGTSGSGKSTLLNMMAGLEKPTKGSITIFGERVDNMSERRLAMFRQKYMGFVFQSYNLLPNLTAVDNVSLPLAFAGVRRSVRTKKAKQMLKLCGLSKRMHHKPTQMSGGQQQRVGIARAFVGTPKIVFADEPTGNLDTKTTIEIMEMMVRMSRENKQTLVIVTHDIEIAGYADRIYHIIDGRINSVEDNRDKQILPGQYPNPVDATVAEEVPPEADSEESAPAAEVTESAETEILSPDEGETAVPESESPPEDDADREISDILRNSQITNETDTEEYI